MQILPLRDSYIKNKQELDNHSNQTLKFGSIAVDNFKSTENRNSI